MRKHTVMLAVAAIAVTAFSITAGPASAAPTPGVKAGYVATGRDFRYAQATITVPDGRSTASSPLVYAGLEGPGAGAVAGVAPCGSRALPPSHCPSGGWTGFYATSITTLARGHVHFTPLHPVRSGQAVAVSVYLNVAGGALHFSITPAGEQPVFLASAAPGGPTYTNAVAVDDWTAAPLPGPPAEHTTVNSFTGGHFTTLSGVQGTFNGPWTLTAVGGDGFAPGPLTGGGTGFRVSQAP